MKSVLTKISNSFIFQETINFIPLGRAIKIFKYNKSFLNKLNFTKKEARLILFMNKLVKPIANMEDYLPVLRKMHYGKIEQIFCKFLNFSNTIPSITLKSRNEEILDLLNGFKICLDNNFKGLFYEINDEGILEFDPKIFLELTHKYAKKLKEISFMDNTFFYSKSNDKKEKENSLTLIKFLLFISTVNKIEDRYFEESDNSLFLDLLNSKYDIENYKTIYNNEYSEKIILNNIKDIIFNLKSYSIYFDNYNSKIVRSICDTILNTGKNLEELYITTIEKKDSIYFLNSLKNLKKLKVLSISSLSDDEDIYDEISKIIPENSLYKLEVNCYFFEEVLNIINKNKNSIKILSINIKEESNNILIVKTLSNLPSLTDLKIIANFPIIDNQNINFFSLNKVKNLEMSLFIKENFFDLNLFFKKIPNLSKISFQGINLLNKNYDNISNINFDETSIKKLKSFKFLYGNENASFFVLNFILKFPKKLNIKNISIENIHFKDYTQINNLIDYISLYTNLISLELNYLTFEEKKNQIIKYSNLKNLQKITKISFLGFKYKEWGIKDISFIEFIIGNFKHLFEIGISSYYLSYNKINHIFVLLKSLKYLTKIKILTNYSKNYFFTEKQEKEELINGYIEDSYEYEQIIEDIEEEEYEDKNNSDKSFDSISYEDDKGFIKLSKCLNYFMIDIRNIDFDYINECIEDNHYNKISINDYFTNDNINSFDEISNNKYEEYYIFKKVYDNNNLYLRYSRIKDSFIIGNSLVFSNSLMVFFGNNF